MDVLCHADDFGITVEQSELILSCSNAAGGNGALNSTSVMVNTPYFEECSALLREKVPQVFYETPQMKAPAFHVGLHLNLVEGFCCSDPNDIPLLVDESGRFSNSFGGLLALSIGRRAKEMCRQLEVEISAQVDLFLASFPELRYRFRVDGHQHSHLIPSVFHSLVSVLESSDCTVEYVRIPSEPESAFLRNVGVWSKIVPVNWVKHFLLNVLWIINKRSYPESWDKPRAFCGVAFSGEMTTDKVLKVLPELVDYANRHNVGLELLFHPGGLRDASTVLDVSKKGFVDFYLSEGRTKEAMAIKELQPAIQALENNKATI